MSVVNITTKEEFNNLIKGDKVLLVDFWAEWCAPCRAMAPILDQLSAQHDNLVVVKVNIESSQDNAALATEHGVQGIPSMVVYKAGKAVHNLVGMRSAPALENELKPYL